MNTSSLISAAALLAAAASLSPLSAQQVPAPPNPALCAPMNGVQFVCGVRNAEDETQVPGTRWIIATGKSLGEGIKLVDTDAKTEQLFFTGAPAQIHPDKKLYPNCPAPLDPKTFIAHGLYLRATKTPGLYNLYVVSHGKLESVEVFSVDARRPQPSLNWTGCVPYPAGDTKGNSVAAYSDGTIIATDFSHPGADGLPPSDVLEWKPGADGFHVIPGTEHLAGANGLEISPDESEFYVAVSFGPRVVYAFSRKDPSKPLRMSATAPNLTPDNLRWSGNRLLVGGTTYDEPACGGQAGPGKRCNRGYVIAEIDPKTMEWTMVAYAEPHSEFSGVATGVIVGDTLWLGANQQEGLAYRPLPGH